jgi:hypothetical protein
MYKKLLHSQVADMNSEINDIFVFQSNFLSISFSKVYENLVCYRVFYYLLKKYKNGQF